MKFATTATVIAAALALFNPAEAKIRGRQIFLYLIRNHDQGKMVDPLNFLNEKNRDMDDSLGNPLRNKGNLGNLGNPRFPSWDVDDSLGGLPSNEYLRNLGNLKPRFPSWDVDDEIGEQYKYEHGPHGYEKYQERTNPIARAFLGARKNVEWHRYKDADESDGLGFDSYDLGCMAFPNAPVCRRL
jgi:hypothetical protein